MLALRRLSTESDIAQTTPMRRRAMPSKDCVNFPVSDQRLRRDPGPKTFFKPEVWACERSESAYPLSYSVYADVNLSDSPRAFPHKLEQRQASFSRRPYSASSDAPQPHQ